MLDFIQKGLSYGLQGLEAGWSSFQNLPSRVKWGATALYGTYAAYEVWTMYQLAMMTGENVSDYWESNDAIMGALGSVYLTGEAAVYLMGHLMQLAAVGAFGLASASIYEQVEPLYYKYLAATPQGEAAEPLALDASGLQTEEPTHQVQQEEEPTPEDEGQRLGM